MKSFCSKLRPFDIAVYIYIFAIISILLLFGKFSEIALFNIAALIIYLLIISLIIFRYDHHVSGWRALLRRAYPLFSILSLYEQVGQFINIIFPVFYDYQIIALEKSILGVNPTIALQSVYHPILNELFYFCYFTYFFFVLVVGIYLYTNKQYGIFEKLVTVSCITYFISYIIFILYPVEGPRYALAESYWMIPEGCLFVPFTNWIIAQGGLHGGCMPSSHVAVSLTSTLIVSKYAKKLLIYYILFSIGLAIGTVWGRFHYLSDVAAGILVGIVSFVISENLTKNLKS